MSGEHELKINPVILSNLKNLLGLNWIHHRPFFGCLINYPETQFTTDTYISKCNIHTYIYIYTIIGGTHDACAI